MAYDIRPLSLGEILDRAFRVYLDNFSLLFGISCVVWIPYALIFVLVGFVSAQAANIAATLFIMVAGTALNAALKMAVASVYLDRPITISEAYRSAFEILVPMFGTYLLIVVLFFIPGAVLGGLFLASHALFAIGVLGLIVVGGYFIVSWALTSPVMVIERRFGLSALRRSRELVQDAWWLTLGFLFAVALIAGVPSSALKFVWGYIPIVGVILSALTQAIFTNYSGVASIIYYFDRRCRTEEFDLRFLAEQVRSQSTPSMAPVPGSSSLA